MEQRISIVTLGVADLERSRTFYESLGWRTSRASSEGIAFFQTGGMILALYPRADLAKDASVAAEGQGFPGFSISYNTRARTEVDAVLAEAEVAGAKILKPAQEGVGDRGRIDPILALRDLVLQRCRFHNDHLTSGIGPAGKGLDRVETPTAIRAARPEAAGHGRPAERRSRRRPRSASMPCRRGLPRHIRRTPSAARPLEHQARRAGPSGVTDFNRAKMMIRWAAL